MVRLWAVLGLLLAVSSAACAPAGYQYGAWSVTDPGQAFRLQPRDGCQRPELTSAGALQWINSHIGEPHGPPGRVVAIQSLSGAPYADESSSISCHGSIVLADGSTEAGTLQFSDPGGSGSLGVAWQSDAERDKPEQWMVDLQNACRNTRGNYGMCVSNGQIRHGDCTTLRVTAYSTMVSLDASMASTHATAEQIAEANYGGASSWRPMLGSEPNPVSYADARLIFQMAVAQAGTTDPEVFSQNIMNMCMQQ